MNSIASINIPRYSDKQYSVKLKCKLGMPLNESDKSIIKSDYLDQLNAGLSESEAENYISVKYANISIKDMIN